MTNADAHSVVNNGRSDIIIINGNDVTSVGRRDNSVILLPELPAIACLSDGYQHPLERAINGDVNNGIFRRLRNFIPFFYGYQLFGVINRTDKDGLGSLPPHKRDGGGRGVFRRVTIVAKPEDVGILGYQRRGNKPARGHGTVQHHIDDLDSSLVHSREITGESNDLGRQNRQGVVRLPDSPAGIDFALPVVVRTIKHGRESELNIVGFATECRNIDGDRYVRGARAIRDTEDGLLGCQSATLG